MKAAIFFLFILLTIGCDQSEPSINKTETRDSVLQEYMSMVDSNEYYDTTAYDFKVLRSYINNDTVFLRKMSDDLKLWKLEESFYDLDSCVYLKKLTELNVDEVYRFRHSQSFCFFGQIITITRSSDEIQLHYVEYSNGEGQIFWNSSGDTIPPYCEIIKDFSKKLSTNYWEEIETLLKKADYWGLKSHNYQSGFDGSSWKVEGYSREPRFMTGQQIHRVYRWSPQNSFKELGMLFMKLSG